ncbi:YaaC family protein [Fictibacillus sp. Mic-4]|uniref:YaaC family protein n=1 Tax=Fictibacillus TaxID=1329200 RepID=UPI0003FED2FB|nr:YaaC family protein [Fictibacillus gelatini]
MDFWPMYDSFYSSIRVQSYLCTCYRSMNIEKAESKSFENCYPFIYYLEHGKKYYSLSANAPLELQPVLLFYGMIQLLKACILTVDPDYPENSSVLAHGVTTRKRKKRFYEFSNDEVKIQKSGLFTHFCEKMFHVKHIEGEKVKMGDILPLIPELHELYFFIHKQNFIVKATIEGLEFQLPNRILDGLHMPLPRFLDFLNSFYRESVFENSYETKSSIVLTSKKSLSPLESYPFIYHLNGSFYLPNQREFFRPYNEVMIHYLILYNLSMICRYETEWWGDLFHTYSSNDLPLIKQFLEVTALKVPYLLGLYLLNKDTPS